MDSRRGAVKAWASCGLITLFLWSPAAVQAEEQKGPELKSVTYFGGPGNQGTAQDGMGIAVSGTKLYVSGADMSLYGGQALVACATVPPGNAPSWSFRWPNRKGNGWWNDETFPGIAVTAEGIYCAGRSWAVVTDGVGGKETKAVLVKFPLAGATGPGIGGATWVAEPHFFPYTGIETFLDVTAVQEGTATTLYAGGRGQFDGSNNTAVLAKFDTAGNVLWKKVLGDPTPYYKWSQVDSVSALNGFIYASGYIHYPTDRPAIRPHAGLWKVDPSGNVVWYRESIQPITQNSGNLIRVVPLEGFLYVSAAQENAPNGGADVLALKYSQAGDLVWSRNWGSSKDDVPMGIAGGGDRLFLVGYTTGWAGGAKDAFLLEMDPEAGEVLSVNYHGGANDDVAYGLQAAGEELYIAGDSKSNPENLGQSEVMLLRYGLTREPPILQVTLDIKPDSFPNPVNLKSKGNIPVAILSTREWSAPDEVDRKTVTFGRTGDESSLAASGCKVEDVNADGLKDLLCHFMTQKAGFGPSDTQGILRGKLLSGRAFVGTDSIRIVGLDEEKAESKPPKQEKRVEKERLPAPAQVPGRKPAGPAPPRGDLDKVQKESGILY